MPHKVFIKDGEPVLDRCNPDVDPSGCDLSKPNVFGEDEFDAARELQTALAESAVTTTGAAQTDTPARDAGEDTPGRAAGD